MVDTFGQPNPLVAFKDSRPPSASGSRRNNGLKSASPPQMYTSEEAPMAAEEYTGTTTVNSSPCKMPNSGRSNGSSNSFPKARNIANTANSNNNQRTESLLMRKKGLPWLLASAFVVIVVLLILCGFLLYVLYEHHGFHSQIDGTRPNSQVPQTQKLHQNSVDEAKTSTKWPKQSQKSMEVRFTRAAVLSENGICSEIGRKVLLQGGNAVDAALSVAFCVGALNPHSAGLGGGFLMTYYRRFYGKCTTIDARETAPARTNKDIFGNSSHEDGGGSSQYGYKSVATPGLLHGFWTAFKRFGSGKIAWMDLLMPTVHLLSDGFPVSELMAKNLEENRERIINGSHSGMRSHFTNPATGQLYQEGELIRDNVLAETLKRLALSHEPLQLFYSVNGDMAKLIADEFAANGGFITRKDLHTYRSVVDEQPLLVTSEAEPKFVLCGAKPSSSFAITQLILAVMLKFYPPGSNSSIPWHSDEYYHRLIESQKHAFAMRNKLGDPKFDKISEEFALNMTRADFVDGIVAEISGRGVSKWKDFAKSTKEFAPENSGGTSQVIVVDADGNAISMTSSINKAFGSLIRSPQLGLIWNDHMDDFSQPNRTNFYGLAPSETNFIEAGKRPMSSMSPMVVYHKDSRKVKIVIGASGGTLIPTAMSQVLLQLLAFNHSLKEAIDTPRLHNQFTPFVTDFEKEFPQFLVQLLRARGHNMTTNSRNFSSSVQAILTDSEGNLLANNDFRRKVHTYPVGY
uniref:Gamma-glutamyl transpeptidase n=1 Tax=Globodera rostochiensis TaxID=31243 RepID=A0A914HS08_GLORO